MLLMVGKGIRGGICHAIYWYAKTNKKYIKNYDENKKSLYLKHWDVNNLYGCALSQELPVNRLKWVEYISKFDEGSVKGYNEKSKEIYFFEVDVSEVT